MKEVIKNKTKKILIIVSIIFLPILTYVIIDYKNLYVDIYNFGQLNKAKPYLKLIGEKDEIFFLSSEFNSKYNINIQPLKNCYYISNYNGSEKYIFGFKLESKVFKKIYKTEYYAYPKYDMPVKLAGPLFTSSDYTDDFNPDSSRSRFEYTISKPCEE